MQLLELPVELFDGIIDEATRDGSLYFICRLREVNKLFESAVTTRIAKYWLCKLTRRELDGISQPLLARLVAMLMVPENRDVNELRLHLHDTIEHLAKSFPATPWRERVEDALRICGMSSASRHPLRSTGYYRHRYSTGRYRFTAEPMTQCPPNCQHKIPPSVATTAFMLAVIRDDGENQELMLAQGSDPNTPCFYFGYPLTMAARLGHTQTVTRLMVAGAEEQGTEALSRATSADQVDVVEILLASPAYSTGSRRLSGSIDKFAVRSDSRVMLELFLKLDLESGTPLRSMQYSALQVAGRNGWNDLIRSTLKSDELAKNCSSHAKHALESAARGGQLSSCQVSFEYVQPAALDAGEMWKAAAYGGNVEVLEFLIQKEIKAKCHDQMVVTAAMRGHKDMLKYALDNEYHEMCEDPTTCLHYSLLVGIYNCSPQTVEYLVTRFNINLDLCLLRQDSSEIEPFSRKIRHVQDGVIEIYPLIAAIDTGSSVMVRLLMQLGASTLSIDMESVDFSTETRYQRWSAVRYGVEYDQMLWYWKDWVYKVLPGKVFRALRAAEP